MSVTWNSKVLQIKMIFCHAVLAMNLFVFKLVKVALQMYISPLNRFRWAFQYLTDLLAVAILELQKTF